MKTQTTAGLFIGMGLTLTAMCAEVGWNGTGSWFDPTAWPGGALPATNDVVNISAGSRVTFAGAPDAVSQVERVNLAVTGDETPATMDISSGQFKLTNFNLATVSNAVGRVVQSGGDLAIGKSSWSLWLALGSAAGGKGTYELSGGNLSVSGNINVGQNGEGELLQTGGALTASGWLVVGYGAGVTGRYEVSAGTAQIGYGLIVGEHGVGHAVIREAGINTMNRLGINGVSELELQPGGTLTFAYAEKQANGPGDDGRLTLDGGTVVYRGDVALQSNFISNTLDHVYVKDRGVTISVPENSTAVSQKGLEAHPDAMAGDVTKTGGGTLSLQGANTFKGKLKVQEGMVVLAHANALDSYGPDKLEIAPGASVAVGTALPAADRAALAARVAATADAGYGIDTTGGDLVSSDPIVLTGAGGFSKFGPNWLTLTGQNAWGGETRIVEGTLAAARGAGLPAASTLCFAGNGIWAPLADVALSFGMGAGQVYALDGATRWGFATTTDDVMIASSAPITTGVSPTKPATLTLDAAADTKLTLSADLNFGVNTSIETPRAGTAVLTGKVAPQGGARTLTKTGNGTLVVKGEIASTDNSRNSVSVNGGVVDVQSFLAEIGTLWVQNGGMLYLTNNATVTTTGLVHCGYAGQGRIVQDNGSLSEAGSGENTLGYVAGSTGTWEMNGGSVMLSKALQIGQKGTGVFRQTGGDVTVKNWVGIARNGSGTGLLEVSGGTFRQDNSSAWLSLCHDGPGDATLIVRDEGVVSSTAVGLAYAYGATGRARVIVKDGGRLETGYFSITDKKLTLGERTIAFDGGTLKATQNQNCFLRSEPMIDVGTGGITFDSAAYTVGFAAQDFAPTGESMVLTKKGEGTMVLAGGVPDATELRVDAGTVSLPLAGKPRGLLHRWSFNGDFVDSAGGLSATKVGNPTFVNNQLHVPSGGANSCGVNLGTDVLPSDRPVTLEVWSTLNASSSWNMLLDFGKDNNSHFAIVWRDSNATGNMSVILNGGGTTVANYGTTSADYLVKPVHGTQYHFAFKFIPDGLGGTRVIVCQTEAATGKRVAMWQKQVNNWTLAKVTQSHCYLGGPTTHNNAIGDSDIDEVRVWGRALTPAELAASVAAGPNTVPDFYFLDAAKAASSLVVAENAAVDLAGSEVALDGVAGAGVVSNGTLTVTGELSPGADAVGTLHVDGNLVVKGTLRLDRGDRIECTGDLDLSGAHVQIVDRRNWNGNSAYTFATVNGTIRRAGNIPCNESDKGFVVCTGGHTAYIYVGGTIIFLR